MNKSFKFFAFAAVAAAMLTSCKKDGFAVKDSFCVKAICPETKTAADGFNVNWASNDAISVFYAPAGTDTYTDAGRFAYAENSLFSSDNAPELGGGNYDWVAVYPYKSETHSDSKYNILKHDAKTVEVVIGGRKANPQVQNGNGNTSHIAGITAPLYGTAKNVEGVQMPLLQMHQAAALVSVDVTSSIDQAFIVKGVEFTAPCNVVGQYYIDTTKDNPVYDAEYEGALSKTAVLQVNGGSSIEKGGKASFFILTAPFKASAGEKIAVTVISNIGTCVKEVELASDIDVKAGKIAHLNFNYDSAVSGSYLPSEPEEISGTFTHNGNTDDPKLTLTTSSGITIIQSKGTRAEKDNWPKATYNTVTKMRVYSGNYLAFSGKKFKKIEFSYNEGTTSSTSTTLVRPTTAVTVIEGGGSYTGAIDGSDAALNGYWAGESESVTLKWGNQVRFTSIKVTYLDFVAGGTPVIETVDVITGEATGQKSNSYKDWSGLEMPSGAAYAGNHRYLNGDMMYKADNTSRLYTTASAGFVKSIAINGSYNMNGSGRKFNVYASDTPFAADTDLSALEPVGVISVDQGKTSVFTFSGDYKHFAFRRTNSSDANVESVVVTWRNK